MASFKESVRILGIDIRQLNVFVIRTPIGMPVDPDTDVDRIVRQF